MGNPIPDEAGWLLDEYDGEVFWAKVTFHDGTPYANDPLATAVGECWEWHGQVDSKGYGQFRRFETITAAHRVSFRDFGGKLTDDQEIDHLCRNHSCVRPSHLEAVTGQENRRRGLSALRHSHCRRGHELTEANIIIQQRGDRTVHSCRTCVAASRHRSYLRRKAA